MTFVNSTKTPSDGTLLGRTSRRFFWCLLLFFIQAVFVMLVVVVFTFPGYFFVPPGLHLRFSGPWRPPPALSSTLATFDICTFPSHFYRECYGFEWAFFIHRRFLPYSPSRHLIQPAFIKDFPGSRQFFLEGSRTSHWGSKHRPRPSVCLNHTVFSKSY